MNVFDRSVYLAFAVVAFTSMAAGYTFPSNRRGDRFGVSVIPVVQVR